MGYGQFRPGGLAPKRTAHRLAWEDANGRPIPLGMCILHRCDNPGCVNPEHLFLGSYKDNAADMSAKGRRIVVTKRGREIWVPGRTQQRRLRRYDRPLRGTEIGTSKLTAVAVRDLYQRYLRGEAIRALARRLGLDHSTVQDIVRGRRWSHLLGCDGAPTLEQLNAVPPARPPTTLVATDIPQIRALLAAGHQGKDIAKRFGVHKATISDIKQGKIWRDA
jgi:DNA-binding MarR family transcriptional regulator